MKNVRLSLRHFFERQAAEEQQETVAVTATTEGETTAEQTGEEATPEETTSTEEPTAEATAEASAPRVVEMSEAEFTSLQADAQSWRTTGASLQTALDVFGATAEERADYKSRADLALKQAGNLRNAGVPPLADATTTEQSGAKSYEQAPWNSHLQKA